MEKRYPAAALSLSLAMLLTACAGSASHDEQMEYLRRMAQRGADIHAPDSHGLGDTEECVDTYEGLYEGLHEPDAPYLENPDDKVRLIAQGKHYFIDSCVNGLPASLPGDPVQPASSSVSPASGATP